MAQDTTPAIICYQGDGSNHPFDVPFDKGYYGEVKVLFVRRGLADYTYYPNTFVVNGKLCAWQNGGAKVYTHTPNPVVGAKTYNSSDVEQVGITVSAVAGQTITVDSLVYTRAVQHDISSNMKLTWTGDTLQVGDFICIIRETERGQPYIMPNNQKHIERALDNIERQVQELQAASDNALKVDPSHDIEDSHKMNPVDWMETIIRSVDKSVRGLRYANGWLDYSLDDPNIADADKTWTHLLNTQNIKDIRERSQTEDGVTTYWTEYQASDGTWRTLANTSEWEAKIADALAKSEYAVDTSDEAKGIAQDAKDIADTFDGRLSQAEQDSSDAKNTVNTHVTDTANPHSVTATQVGLGNCDNTADLDKPISTATQTVLTSLQNQIDDVSGRGRFLSVWNCATGLAETNPPESPYTYKTGDYFIVGTVSSATPAVNYKPNGSSYTTGVASTTVETNEVKIDDTYIYDGTTWKLQANSQRTYTFAGIAGSPYDNSNLSNALNGKVDKTSTANQVYGTNNSGTQTTYTVDNADGANTVVARDANKQIKVAETPTDNKHATSKKYVDDGLALKQNEATALNYDNISNCITNIPQDINLSLSNGTLTLKAGSKLSFPDGTQYTITEDKTATGFTGANGQFVISFAKTYGNLQTCNINTYSGAEPATPVSRDLWYDTTNQKIKRYWSTTWQDGNFSFPLCIITETNGVITSIDKVFNGIGYIGTMLFVLPGVKYLIPNGRNTDGTLKNTAVTIDRVLVSGAVGQWAERDIVLTSWSAKIGHVDTNTVVYNEEKNFNIYNNSNYPGIKVGHIKVLNNIVADYSVDTTPLHLVDYNDYADLKSDLESNKANIDLDNLSATGKANVSAQGTYNSGTTYTAGTVGAAIKSKADAATSANTDLSNLTSKGNNISNWSSNVSNCIVEIPQNIKLELSSGTLTLKSGSKVYVPNGSGVFDAVTTSTDITHTNSNNGTFILYKNPGNYINYQSATTMVSGTTDPLAGTPWHIWYDTTNNVIKRYTNDGTTPYPGQSFPIAVYTVSNGAISSIDQVFNGFGYIGSTIFALPGVKGLIPNGRNADGSLNNILTTPATTVKTSTKTSGNTGRKTMTLNNIGYVDRPGGLEYNERENRNYNFGSLSNQCICGYFTVGNDYKITDFVVKTAFHAVDYSDFVDGLAAKQDTISDLATIRSGAAAGATAVQPAGVGNGTITVNQGGVLKGTFTTNQSGNTTIDLEAGTADAANKNLSNLTSTGNNISNWSTNVSNCITKIPQDITLTLASGTLTLKSGSKVYVPNGANNYDAVTLTADKSNYITGSGQALVYYSPSLGSIFIRYANRSVSGTTRPMTQSYMVWYDTTNNVINEYYDDASTPRTTVSFPVAVVTLGDSGIASIDQVFNGFGYIGSTIFTLPGVSVLAPDGTNQDGTLKTYAYTVPSVMLRTDTSNGTRLVAINCNNGSYGAGNYVYNRITNYNYINNAISDKRCIVASMTVASGMVSGLTIKMPFHATDYYDFTSELDKKIDKLSTAAIVYGTNYAGSQIYIAYTSNNTNWTIAQRNGSGNISVGLTPTDDANATSKKYVDDSLTTKQDTATALNYNNISNCITEMPQNIKLTLSSGTLTLKAGSVITKPDGTQFTTEADKTYSPTGAASDKCFIFGLVSNTNHMTMASTNNVSSGLDANVPSTGIYYATDTQKMYLNGSINNDLCLPIALVDTDSNGAVANIDQVFNGFGYVGSTVFALPGVKGLMPNGRNADGTLKNTSVTVTSMRTLTLPSTVTDVYVLVALSETELQGISGNLYKYDAENNLVYDSGVVKKRCVFASFHADSNAKITLFQKKQAFQAMDYSEADFVVEYQKPTAENNYTWYRKYKSGWIEQGGALALTDTAATQFQIALPVQMANDRYTVTAAWHLSSSATGMYAVGVQSKTTTGFVLLGHNTAMTVNNVADWVVSGMAAD